MSVHTAHLVVRRLVEAIWHLVQALVDNLEALTHLLESDEVAVEAVPVAGDLRVTSNMNTQGS